MTLFCRCVLILWRSLNRRRSGLAFIFASSLFPGNELLADDRVLIISPHNEAIRVEFGRGFSRWYEEKFGGPVTVEWRDVGGTADNLRFVQSEFAAKPDGIGIDIFFAGGARTFFLLADIRLAHP